jgi:hypothetical protein
MKTRRSCRPALEMLEVRDTPAGTVTGSFFNGTWTLIGDAEANSIRINPTANQNEFAVTGQGGTTVAGVLTASNVQNIVVKLRGGDDRVVVNDTGNVARLLGKLTIAGGNGANYVQIIDLKMKGVTVTNGLNIAGYDDVYLTSLIVQGNVTVNNGHGESYTTIDRNDYDAFNRIGGNLTVLNGTGENGTYIVDAYIVGNVVVRNGLPNANNEAGYVEFYNDYRSSRSFVLGNVSVSYQGGYASYDELFDLEVFGNVKFNYGSGSGYLEIGSYYTYQPTHIHGNLTVLSQGDTKVDIGQYNYYPIELIVDRNFTLLTGAGTDEINIWALNVRGATLIATGAGNDTIAIDDSIFTGPTTLRTGAGLDTVLLEAVDYVYNSTQFLKALTIRMGLDNDTLTIGAANAYNRFAEVLGLAVLDGGAGDDTFNRFDLVAAGDGAVTALFETINV